MIAKQCSLMGRHYQSHPTLNLFDASLCILSKTLGIDSVLTGVWHSAQNLLELSAK